MDSHISRQYTLAELEPGWPEDLRSKRTKSSPRTQGSMRMSLRKVSRTPENSRAYSHGDPVNLIDWQAYARTDELVVREHRDEASARVMIVFDSAPTLSWPLKEDLEFHGGIGSAIAKSELAIRLALYFAHAHLTIGDTVTVASIEGTDGIQKLWSPKSPADVQRVYEACLRQGFTSGINSFMSSNEFHRPGCDVAWIITDFLTEGFYVTGSLPASQESSENPILLNSLFDELGSKVANVVHVFSWLERSSEWMDGATSYRDESEDLKIYMGDQLKQAGTWVEQLSVWQRRVRASVKSKGGHYLAVDDRTKVSDFFHWLGKEVVT